MEVDHFGVSIDVRRRQSGRGSDPTFGETFTTARGDPPRNAQEWVEICHFAKHDAGETIRGAP